MIKGRPHWRRITWVLIAWCALAVGCVLLGAGVRMVLPVALIGVVVLTLLWRLTRAKGRSEESTAARAGPTFDW